MNMVKHADRFVRGLAPIGTAVVILLLSFLSFAGVALFTIGFVFLIKHLPVASYTILGIVLTAGVAYLLGYLQEL
jgi:hypothetical protein